MADKTRQIGAVWSETDEKGTLYELSLFINNADYAAYTPTSAGKTPTTGQGGETYPTALAPLLSAGTYIYRYVRRPLGDHWQFTIYACNDDYDWGENQFELDVDNAKVNRSFDKAPLFLPAKWWGIIQFQFHNLWGTSTPAPNIYDGSAVAKNATDLVFANAPTAATGSAAFNKDSGLPFAKSNTGTMPTVTEMPITFVNATVMVTRYTCVMYRATSVSIESYIAWNGINPGGTSGGFTPPAGCAPTGYLSKAMWLAMGQTLVENGKTINGNSYDVITRVMHLVPTLGAQLYWNSTLYPTWTWGV